MDFNTIAAKKLNEQLPGLGKYIKSFKDMTHEAPEDAGINIGAFCLRIKNTSVFVPVYSKGNTVMPIEALFYYDQEGAVHYIPADRDVIDALIEQDTSLGSPSKIPQGVARNPSLRDAVVPPKTGKFVYASESRLGDMIHLLPDSVRESFSKDVEGSTELRNIINVLLNEAAIREALAYKTPEFQPPTPNKAKVITEGEMSDEQKQAVINNGYAVSNDNVKPVFAITHAEDGKFRKASSLGDGEAALAVLRNGKRLGCVKLRTSHNPLFLFEDGTVTSGEDFVITGEIFDKKLVMTHQSVKAISEVEQGDRIVLFDGLTYEMKGDVRKVVDSGVKEIVTSRGTLITSPAVKSLRFEREDGVTMIRPDAQVIVLGESSPKLETHIGKAQAMLAARDSIACPITCNIQHNAGLYAVNGKPVGTKIDMIRKGVEEWSMPAAQIEGITKKAEETGSLMVKMAATNPTPIESFGQAPQPQKAISGTANERKQGMEKAVKQGNAVRDAMVAEAALMAQMLSHVDLDSSLQEFLPDIEQAVDKLGRSLMVLRINTPELSERMDAESVNTMITSVRNCFRDLGKTYLKLKGLVQTV